MDNQRPVKMIVLPRPRIVDDEEVEIMDREYAKFTRWERFKIFLGLMKVEYDWDKQIFYIYK